MSIGPDGQFNERSKRDIINANAALYGADYVDPENFRKTELTIYVWSVVDERPAGAHLFRCFPPLLPRLQIAELKPGQRYCLVTTIPHPVNQQCMRENGERYIDYHSGRRVAMDIVDPDNLTLNQDFQVDPSRVFSQGNNYGRLGVFWTETPKPSDEDVKKAIKRKETYYRARLQQARVLEMTNPRALAEYLTINDHIACDYFGEEYSWHKKMVKVETCPNCGEAISPGVAFHKSMALDGALCVIDSERASRAGVKNKSTVIPSSSRKEPPADD
jgi:hypothetical protein